ncbi:MAG: DNA-binding response regulator [Flavobacterium sp. BFFFF1]|uniref:response regulator n=1 Tax=unclassified Flavobacterium TaxID=196869 RepID=UPI000BD8BA68|nr:MULTISPECIES: response regulator transcription factor [unclassified Flavobacterium]OYU80860.1 MAG: DNA-binding response regulator [Flavobacterium sp. BFFFF1]
MITVVIAEDHQAMLDGIRLSLKPENDIRIIGEAKDGEMLLDLVRRTQPLVVVTDIRMPKCDGIAATKIIKNEFPEIKVIAFSMFDQHIAVTQMKEAGASGYIMKSSSVFLLQDAIRSVHVGNTYFDHAIIANDAIAHNSAHLTTREKQILRMIGEGRTTEEIGTELCISSETVGTHRKNIHKKMNLHGKSDLIRYAIESKYDFYSL